MAFDIVYFAFLAALAAWFKVSSGMFSCVSIGVRYWNFMLVLNVRLSAPLCQPLGSFLLYRLTLFFETGGFLQLTFAQLLSFFLLALKTVEKLTVCATMAKSAQQAGSGVAKRYYDSI